MLVARGNKDGGATICVVDQGVGMRTGLGEIPARHNHAGAEFPAGAHLDQRGVVGHDHRHGNAQQPAMISEAERVIAGGSRDDAALALARVELEQRIARAALLERAGALEVVEFAEDPRARDLGERNGLRAGRLDHAAGDAAAGGADVGEGDGGRVNERGR